MLELQRSMNTARPVFQAAIDAATRRFGPHYRDQPITTLDYAAGLVSLDVSTLHAEATFSAMPDVFTSSEWINARRLAGELLLASPPLAEAQGMINEMRRIESLAASAQRVLADFRLAQQALQKCRGVAR